MGHARDYNHDLRRLLASERGRAVQAASRSCDHCWTNCESFTSMLSSPIATIVRALGTRALEGVHEAPDTGKLVEPSPDARRP